MLRFGQRGLLEKKPFGQTRFHIIEASPIMERFLTSSKRNNDPPMLEYLHDLGWRTGDEWMARNAEALGQRSTLDLQQLLPANVWGDI